MNNPGPSCSSNNTTSIEPNKILFEDVDHNKNNKTGFDDAHNRTREDVEKTINTIMNRLDHIFETIIRNMKIINIHNRTHGNTLGLDENILSIYDHFLDHSNSLNNKINCLYDDYPLYKKYMKIIISKLYVFNINSYELSKGFDNNRKLKNYTIIKNLHLSKNNIKILNNINHVKLNKLKESSNLCNDNKWISYENLGAIRLVEDIRSKRIAENEQTMENFNEGKNISQYNIQDSETSFDEHDTTRRSSENNDPVTQNINDQQNTREFNACTFTNIKMKHEIISSSSNNLRGKETLSITKSTNPLMNKINSYMNNEQDFETKNVQHEVRTNSNELKDNVSKEQRKHVQIDSNQEEPEYSDKYNKRKNNELLEIESKKIKANLNGDDFSSFKSLLNQINSDILQLIENINEINLYLQPIQNSIIYGMEDKEEKVLEMNLRHTLIKEKTIKKWQMQQIRRSIFDNVSNTLLEEQNNLRNHEYLLFNTAVLSAISNHGLHNILPDEEMEENDSVESSREENDSMSNRIEPNSALLTDSPGNVNDNNCSVSSTGNTFQLEDIQGINENDATQLDNEEHVLHPTNDEDDFLTQAVGVAILNKGLST